MNDRVLREQWHCLGPFQLVYNCQFWVELERSVLGMMIVGEARIGDVGGLSRLWYQAEKVRIYPVDCRDYAGV